MASVQRTTDLVETVQEVIRFVNSKERTTLKNSCAKDSSSSEVDTDGNQFVSSILSINNSLTAILGDVQAKCSAVVGDSATCWQLCKSGFPKMLFGMTSQLLLLQQRGWYPGMLGHNPFRLVNTLANNCSAWLQQLPFVGLTSSASAPRTFQDICAQLALLVNLAVEFLPTPTARTIVGDINAVCNRLPSLFQSEFTVDSTNEEQTAAVIAVHNALMALLKDDVGSTLTHMMAGTINSNSLSLSNCPSEKVMSFRLLCTLCSLYSCLAPYWRHSNVVNISAVVDQAVHCADVLFCSLQAFQKAWDSKKTNKKSSGLTRQKISMYLSQHRYILWVMPALYKLHTTLPASSQILQKLQTIAGMPVLHSMLQATDIAQQGRLHPLMADDTICDALPLRLKIEVLKSLQPSVEQQLAVIEPAVICPLRANLLESSFEQVMSLPVSDMNSLLRVYFIDEEGQGIGVVREWLSLVAGSLFDPQFGLFKRCSANPRAVYPSESAVFQPRHLEYFEFAGRILGLALLQDVPVRVHLSTAFFHSISGQTATMEHLQEIDADKAAAYNKLLDQSGAGNLCLTFSASSDLFGDHLEVPLTEDGFTRTVDDGNKELYVALLVEYELHGRVQNEVSHFREGLFGVFRDVNILQWFTPASFNALVGGCDDISAPSWRQHTRVSGWTDTKLPSFMRLFKRNPKMNGYKDQVLPPVVCWFWELVNGMKDDERRQLLQFWTGMKSLPDGGFASLPKELEIVRLPFPEHQLPKAQTCFLQLFLPDYSSKQATHKGVMTALKHSEGYGLA